MPRDLTARLRVIVDAPEVVAVRHRRERAVERQDLEAVPRKIELPDDLRPQQRDDVRCDRELETRKDLLRDGGPAEHVAAFENEDSPPGACEVRRVDEPVVSAADDDDIVVGHMSEVRCAMSDVRCPMCDVRCAMSDVRCPMCDAPCPMSD